MLTKYIKTVAAHIASFSAMLAGLSWLLGYYDEVYKWLISHRDITVIGIVVYAVWNFLIYGGKEEEYKNAYNKRLQGAALPPRRKKRRRK